MDECEVGIYYTPEAYKEGVRQLQLIGCKILMFNFLNGAFVVTYSTNGRKKVESTKQ